MDNETPNTLSAAPESVSDNSDYLVHSKSEIVYILRAIMQKNTLVSAHFNQGKEFILTSILDIDGNRDEVILDYSANEVANRRIVEAARIIFVTNQDRIKIQFTSENVAQTQHEGRGAFAVALPESLLKLQRREFYRLETPITHPLKCVVPLPDGKRVELTIADISVGGIGVANPPPEIELKSGALFPGCRIVLPDVGIVAASIEARSVYEITLKNGAKMTRCGCRFVDMPASMQAMVQRYILKLDRERRAMLSDR